MLIALGTSLKLPLSTTYVTFMVAMGTSLADRAWGRESAVYRITGVISVIGGWFVTAGVAAFACFIVTGILYYGGFVAIFILTAIVIYLIIHSQVSFNKKQKQMKEKESFDQQLLSNKDPKQALPHTPSKSMHNSQPGVPRRTVGPSKDFSKTSRAPYARHDTR